MADQKNTVALFSETLSVAFTDQGKGRPYLVLHGGAGPASMAGLAAALSKTSRVIVPTHPGFNGEPRPDWFTRIDDLALAYLALIERLDLSSAVLVGNSLGGWISAVMALHRSPRIAGIVVLDAVGIDTGSPDKKIVDPMSVAPQSGRLSPFTIPNVSRWSRRALSSRSWPKTRKHCTSTRANPCMIRPYVLG